MISDHHPFTDDNLGDDDDGSGAEYLGGDGAVTIYVKLIKGHTHLCYLPWCGAL